MTEELLGPFVEMLDPQQVMPMVVYLCSEQNEHTHEIFTVGGGRYGRVFVGTNTAGSPARAWCPRSRTSASTSMRSATSLSM